jgi:hypothetical protein
MFSRKLDCARHMLSARDLNACRVIIYVLKRHDKVGRRRRTVETQLIRRAAPRIF